MVMNNREVALCIFSLHLVEPRDINHDNFGIMDPSLLGYLVSLALLRVKC